MNKSRALEIINDYWGKPTVVPQSVVDEIQFEQETLLETVARIAGISEEIKAVGAFDHATIRKVVENARNDKE